MTVGLILAGGAGRRMGRADKALLALAGRPMIAHALDRLRPQVAALVLSANGDPGRFSRFGLPVVVDDPPDGAGPLAGVLAGLEFAARAFPQCARVATLPVDLPFAPEDFVARLEAARRAADAEIAVAASGGRTHHVAALWPVALAPELRRTLVEQGLRKVERFMLGFRVATVEWPSEPFDPFMNVNAPEDLVSANARLAAPSGGGPA